jgi:hypothetical protein
MHTVVLLSHLGNFMGQAQDDGRGGPTGKSAALGLKGVGEK